VATSFLLVNGAPLRLAIINDYELVLRGLASQLEPFADRIHLVEAVAGASSEQPADVALFDTFAHGRGIAQVIERCAARRLVAYSWNLQRPLIESVLDHGASGYLSKQLTASQLVEAVERVHAGETVVTQEPGTGTDVQGAWPGQEHGLSEREAEILALITRGLSNREISEHVFISINTVKSYIRSAYRRIGVDTRSRAVLWGVDHGLVPDVFGADSADGTDVLEALSRHREP
jgi:NarL family two-component system response regulator LiaR